MVYITPQKLLFLRVARVSEFVIMCASVLRTVDHWVSGKNDVKKASLYLWLDRYPPVDRYTVIMWLSGVAAGRSLSCESRFPCIRESLLVYLSPPQRPTCTSRHQQDKTRCHIYEAVSSTLMPQRLTAGLWDFSGEGYDSLSAYLIPEPTTTWCFDHCHRAIKRNGNCYTNHFIITSHYDCCQCYHISLIFCHFKFPVLDCLSVCVYNTMII